MEPTMIAIHVIRAESYMFGAHKIHTISQMIKARIYGVIIGVPKEIKRMNTEYP